MASQRPSSRRQPTTRVGAFGPVTGTGESPASQGAFDWPRSTQVPMLAGGTVISGACVPWAVPATVDGAPSVGVDGVAAQPARTAASASADRASAGARREVGGAIGAADAAGTSGVVVMA